MTGTFERTAEYDAFGPWILQVRSTEDVPRAFRDHPLDFTRASSVLKIPRDISRRDADPSMHLYDRLLVIDDDGLDILTRSGDDFSVERVDREAIAAIDYGTDLLAGRLVLHLLGGASHRIPYNATSDRLVAALAEDLVGMSAKAAATGADGIRSQSLALDALGVTDVALVNSYREMASRLGGISIDAMHPGSAPAPLGGLLHRLRERRLRLSGAIVCSDDERLIIHSRLDWYRSSPKPDLSTRRTLIPRSAITGVTVSSDPRADGVASLGIEFTGGRLAVLVPSDSAAATTVPAAFADRATGRRSS